MELFAAVTGCSNPDVARLHLERADNDVARAVNHFLDSPPASDANVESTRTVRMGATPASPVDVHETDHVQTSGSCVRHESTKRSLKRQRVPSPSDAIRGYGVTRSQEPSFRCESQSTWDKSILPFSGKTDSPLERNLDANRPQRTPNGDVAVLQNPVDAVETVETVSAFCPSAKWREVTNLWKRDGTQFEDAQFLPRPTSLDGRPGKGTKGDKGETASSEGQHGDNEKGVCCKCGFPAKVITVGKAGANQGRLFYGCVARKCTFFQWADDAPHTRQALSLVWKRFSPPRFKLSASISAAGGCGFKPQDIRQGAVGDCWFLAGLAVVSERPDLIARVLGGNDGPVSDRSGCFEVNLFKDGRWESVLVDSWLPCKDPARLKGKERGLDYLPAFAKASNNQIWPCVVEKAFAKQHGSYDAISGGHVCEAFEALTGAPTETIMLDDDDSEANWAKLLSFSQAEFPMGCATAWDPSKGLRDVGLVSTHAYSVLEVRELPPGVRGARQPSIRDWAGLGSAAAAAEVARRREGETVGQPVRLVRVRNPWGKREWTGEWSDKSERWSDSVRKELGWSEKNDGTFWMTWQDFMTRFQLVDVCKARKGWAHASAAKHALPRPQASRRAVVGFSIGDSAHAFLLRVSFIVLTRSARFYLDSSFRIRTPPSSGEGPSRTWAYITVVQPTKRGRKDRYWYKALGLLVTEIDTSSSSSNTNGVLVATSLGGAKRSISCEVFLESGKAYTASVVCLSGSHHHSDHDGMNDLTETASTSVPTTQTTARNIAFRGFLVTVYSAHPLKVVPGEKRPTSAGYFAVGPSFHQAISHRLLEACVTDSKDGTETGPVQSFALCGGAALAVMEPAGGSAVLFILINASSDAIRLCLTMTSLEGATISKATPTAESVSNHNCVTATCPPLSQKIILVLARIADYGTFRHSFFYRMALPTSPHLKSLPAKGTATAAAPSGKQYATADDLASTAVSSAAWDSSQSQEVVKGAVVDLSGVSPRKDEGGEAERHRVALNAHMGEADGDPDESCASSVAAHSKEDGGEVFSAQPLLPGAEGVVRRAHVKRTEERGGSGLSSMLIEGYGGGTVGGGGRGIGSAS